MNGALLQQKIGYGLSKAAAAVGLPHTQYRPLVSGINPPLSAVYALGTVNAAFTLAGGMLPGKWAAQSQPNQIYWQSMVSGVQPGDYLVGQNTWVIVALDQIMTPIALRCTQTLTFARQPQAAQVGVQAYAAMTTPQPKIYALQIPGVLNIKKETGRPIAGLPGDAGLRAFMNAAFWLPDGLVQVRDIVTDENGQRYQVVTVSTGLLGTQALLEVLES